MLRLFKRLFDSYTPVIALIAPQCPQTAQTPAWGIRAMEELAWQAEAVEWELERMKRQEIIYLAELTREKAILDAEAKREWSRRMHKAKAAKRALAKAK
jgi:hypothetical protein